jgi:hypothetical protein
LIDKLALEARETLWVCRRCREEAVDAFVRRDATDKLVHHCGDGGLPAEALVQRRLFRLRERDAQCERKQAKS